MTLLHTPPVRQTVRYRLTFYETVTRSNRSVFNGTVSDKIERLATDQRTGLDYLIRLGGNTASTVRLDLRYAAQDRHRPACTPKSSRRLVHVFRLTSFLLVSVPLTLSYASTVREALPLTIHDPRLRFTIL